MEVIRSRCHLQHNADLRQKEEEQEIERERAKWFVMEASCIGHGQG